MKTLFVTIHPMIIHVQFGLRFNKKYSFGKKIIINLHTLYTRPSTLYSVLMDLSKAFDFLPHKLLLLKLEAYGMSKSALQLIENYLTNRKQCVKVGTTLSNWQDIYKAQGLDASEK